MFLVWEALELEVLHPPRCAVHQPLVEEVLHPHLWQAHLQHHLLEEVVEEQPPRHPRKPG